MVALSPCFHAALVVGFCGGIGNAILVAVQVLGVTLTRFTLMVFSKR